MQTYTVLVRREDGDWSDDFVGGEYCAGLTLQEARVGAEDQRRLWPDAEWCVADEETMTPNPQILDGIVISR